MSPDMVIVPTVFLIPAAVVAFRMWLAHREKMTTLGVQERSPEADARLARLEQAVDAIAIEMERIGEGQRFLTKLMAARPEDVPRRIGAEAARVNTPH